MTTLLRIDASARIAQSYSRIIADDFQTQWQAAYPDGGIIYRDLAKNPPCHLSNETIEQFYSTESHNDAAVLLSEQMIQELQEADHLLISSPLYNLTLPSTLKAYFDHVVRSGLTFELQDGVYRGLLNGKKASIIIARGGIASAGIADDFQTEYLKEILAFIGINSVNIVHVQGTSFPEPEKSEYVAAAKQQIQHLFNRLDDVIWHGLFTSDEKKNISLLRDGQAQAIMQGDAHAYAELCTEDIKLMIPGHDIISGRDAFFHAEESLFSCNTFSSFKKTPLSISRSGDIAVEIGRQEITMEHKADTGGIFSAQQKYMHVFRLTQSGWRYSALMSNPSE